MKRPGFLDRAAIALSGLCLVHCLLLPVIVAGLPFLGQITRDHLHAEVLIVVVPLSLVAFALGFRRHGVKTVIAYGIAGILLLLLGGTVVHGAYGLAADRITTITGSLVLAVAHYFNNRYSRHVPRLSV